MEQQTLNTQHPTATSIAAILDTDNLVHQDRSQTARERRHLDVPSFAAALNRRGVVCGTVCGNRNFDPFTEQLWLQLGFSIVATGNNCDHRVIAEARHYVEAGFRNLVLVSGDGDYVRTVRALQVRGVRVEIWSRRAILSRNLAQAADEVRFVDQFITQPRINTPDVNWSRRRQADLKRTNGDARASEAPFEIQSPQREPTMTKRRVRLRTPWLGIKARFIEMPCERPAAA